MSRKSFDTASLLEIGSRIQEIRGQRTQTEFGKLLGVGRGTVTNYEAGRRLPNNDILEKIARIGDVAVNWILTGERLTGEGSTKMMQGFSDRLALVLRGKFGHGEFAEKVGVSVSGVRKWLAGTSEPTLSKLVAIGKAADISLEWLATGEGAMRQGGIKKPTHQKQSLQLDIVLFGEIIWHLDSALGYSGIYDDQSLGLLASSSLVFLANQIYNKASGIAGVMTQSKAVREEADYLHKLVYGQSSQERFNRILDDNNEENKHDFPDMIIKDSKTLTNDQERLLALIEEYFLLEWDIANLGGFHTMINAPTNFNIYEEDYMYLELKAYRRRVISRLRMGFILDGVVSTDRKHRDFIDAVDLVKCSEEVKTLINDGHKKLLDNYAEGILHKIYMSETEETLERVSKLASTPKNVGILVRTINNGVLVIDKHYPTNISQLPILQDVDKITTSFDVTVAQEYVQRLLKDVFSEFNNFFR